MTVPMPAAHQNFISTSGNQCKALLDLLGMLEQLNTLWAGTPNYQGLIDQAEIDSVPAFAGAGLTTQTLADAEFALANTMTGIHNAIVALTVLGTLP